jgi:hypothetical protein
MKFLLISSVFFFSFIADFTEVCGYYYGEKDDYVTEIKLYDDSTYKYTAKQEYPFEVSEGKWTLKGDTVILNSLPCANPEALAHPPVRTYLTIVDEKYLYRKNSITPLRKDKLIKGEILSKEK